MKKCSKCYSIKYLSEFNHAHDKADNLSSCCRSCASTLSKSYYSSHKEARSLYGKERYTTIKEDKLLYSKLHYQNNKYLYIARGAKRRAAILQASPIWANELLIEEVYRTCPEGYHVDHIVPLQNSLVCGLHCEFNLQHLPAKDNLAKGNRFLIA